VQVKRFANVNITFSVSQYHW